MKIKYIIRLFVEWNEEDNDYIDYCVYDTKEQAEELYKSLKANGEKPIIEEIYVKE